MPDAPAPSLTLAGELFKRFADPISARLLARYRGVDPDAVTDAVLKAVIAFADAPNADPAAADFAHHLTSKARDKLRTTLRGNTRRRHREEKYATAVTDRRAAAPSPAEVAATAELAAVLRDRIAHTPEERAALDLMMNDVSDPAILAARLEITRAEAVTLFARLRQRIKRERDGHADETEDSS